MKSHTTAVNFKEMLKKQTFVDVERELMENNSGLLVEFYNFVKSEYSQVEKDYNENEESCNSTKRQMEALISALETKKESFERAKNNCQKLEETKNNIESCLVESITDDSIERAQKIISKDTVMKKVSESFSKLMASNKNYPLDKISNAVLLKEYENFMEMAGKKIEVKFSKEIQEIIDILY